MMNLNSTSKYIFITLLSASFTLGVLWGVNVKSYDIIAPSEFREIPSKDKRMAKLSEIAERKSPAYSLEFLKETYPTQPSSKHELVHIVGRSAYKKYGPEGFKVCDSAFKYGCYHGVTLEAIQQNGYSENTLDDLAQGCLTLPYGRVTKTACVHGIGHGIMWIESYDLLASFKKCDTMFDDKGNRFFCHDGVAMENVVRRGEQRDNEDLKSELFYGDPLSPCSEVPLDYRDACVREHVQLAYRRFFNRDVKKTADEYCRYFQDETVRKECFGGLGSVVNQIYGNDPENVVEECQKTDEYMTRCIGTAASQYAYSDQPSQGKQICRSLEDDETIQGCIGAVESAKKALDENSKIFDDRR